MVRLGVATSSRGRARSLGVLRSASLAFAGACLIAMSAHAADPAVGIGNRSGSDSFWTPERMRNAKPMSLTGASTTIASDIAAQLAASRLPTVSRNGAPGSASAKPDLSNMLLEPLAAQSGSAPAASIGGGVEGQAKGSSGFPFTTSRVFPDAAVSTYPYRASGKLFLRNPATGATVFCSASVISKRLLGTAGHCVYDTAANRFYDNFRFVPAFNSGNAPYGSWDWAWVWAANTWINSVGSAPFPNNGDFAILEVQDENVAGQVRRIGDYVGFLGWTTNGLIGQHVTTLGYPLNLDNGQKMQTTSSEVRAVSGFNAGQIGNDQTGGSSGGPWLRDFGISGSGNPTTTANRNRIVAYTSYGPTQFGPRYQGASVLNQEWVNMYNQACAHRSGNC